MFLRNSFPYLVCLTSNLYPSTLAGIVFHPLHHVPGSPQDLNHALYHLTIILLISTYTYTTSLPNMVVPFPRLTTSWGKATTNQHLPNFHIVILHQVIPHWHQMAGEDDHLLLLRNTVQYGSHQSCHPLTFVPFS